MAGNGLAGTPPKTTRVSAGLVRDAKGNIVKAQSSGTSKTAKNKGTSAQKLEGLTKGQNALINTRQAQDQGLADTAGTMLGQINSNFSQPFDYSQYKGPAEGDYNNWISGQMGQYNQAFDQRMNPQFAQESQDLEQQLANRGIPMGSELYNREKSRLEQSHNDARTQAYASNQASAANAASQFFNIGTQAQDRGMGLAQSQRYAPLSEFNQLTAAQSPMMQQNLAYSQQRGLNTQQGQIQKSMPRGGGGGGGSSPAWAQAGFSSMQEYDAYRVAQARDQKNWEWANDPNYKKGSGASPWAGFAGSIIGQGLQGWASTWGS